jgi:hypothetical protein
MSRMDNGFGRTALSVLLVSAALMLPSCAKRFGGAWPFGEDQTAELKKYGPAPVQRVQTMQERAKKLAKASPEEKEAFAAEMARQMPNENDFNVRLAVIKMLAQMDTPSARAVLYAGMKDPETEIRVKCCQAWTNKPSPETTHMLAEVLSGDTNLDVRMAAAKALSSARDKEAVAALGQALDDSDPGLRYCVMESLRYVTGKRSIGDNVEKWREIAKQPDPPIGNQRLASRWFDLVF